MRLAGNNSRRPFNPSDKSDSAHTHRSLFFGKRIVFLSFQVALSSTLHHAEDAARCFSDHLEELVHEFNPRQRQSMSIPRQRTTTVVAYREVETPFRGSGLAQPENLTVSGVNPPLEFGPKGVCDITYNPSFKTLISFARSIRILPVAQAVSCL